MGRVVPTNRKIGGGKHVIQCHTVNQRNTAKPTKESYPNPNSINHTHSNCNLSPQNGRNEALSMTKM